MKASFLRFCWFFTFIILICSGCPNPSGSPSIPKVTFISLSADGSEFKTSAKLTLTFSNEIELTKNDILVNPGDTGVIKGILCETGPGIYDLTIGGIEEEGEITVTITRAGIKILDSEKNVKLFFSGPDPEDIPAVFTDLSTDGDPKNKTTKLFLSFDVHEIAELSLEDIFLDPGCTGTEIENLVRIEPGVYQLDVTNVTADGNVRVAVLKDGYAIGPISLSVPVFTDPPIEVNFLNLLTDVSEYATTSKLSLVFDRDIEGFCADDIVLLPGDTGAEKGGLTRIETETETAVYEMEISGISESGEVTVEVSKAGYDIVPDSMSVFVNYAALAEFTMAAAAIRPNTTIAVITLDFDHDIGELSYSNIILSEGITGAVLKNVNGTPTSREFNVYEYEIEIEIYESGIIGIDVQKPDFSIHGGPRIINLDCPAMAAFMNLAANGSAGATSSRLTLYFDGDIEGLDADDITLLPGDTGAVKGTLERNRTGVYYLSVSGVSKSGTVEAVVSREGYAISASSREVYLYHSVSFNGITADGSQLSTTSKLTLDFGEDIIDLDMNDITILYSTTDLIQKKYLTRIGTGIYELGINIENAGILSTNEDITVTVSKAGHYFVPSGRSVRVYHYIPPVPVVFLGVTANGSSDPVQKDATTTLTLKFDRDIPDFSDADITLVSPVINALAVELLPKGGGVYDLEIDLEYPEHQSGTVTVEAAKPGYVFSNSVQTAAVYYWVPDHPVAFQSLVENSGGTNKTTKLTLTFTGDISGLSLAASDISVNARSTGAVKGALTPLGGGVYDLNLDNVTNSGLVTVSVNKQDYAFSPASRNVNVYNTPAQFIAVSGNGTEYTTTTSLTLTFDKAITGLTVNDISFGTNITGAVKGTLSASSPPGAYTLTVSNVGASGDLPVNVSRTGYTISGGPKIASVKYAEPAVFTGLAADGTDYTTSTKLVLTFDRDIGQLTGSNITLTGSVIPIIEDISKRTDKEYELFISGITAGGTVNVNVQKPGYNISGGPLAAAVKYAQPVSFNALTANGSSVKTTTLVTLVFDKDIAGLAASDITLTAGTTGAVKGALNRTAAGVYELAVTGISAGGYLEISASKPGYTNTGMSRQVYIYYAVPVVFTGLTQNGNTAAATTKLVLAFDRDIAGLNSSHVTLTAYGTGINKGSLTRVGTGTYELAVSGLSSSGSAEASVYISGYDISGGPKTTAIYAVGQASFTVTFSQIIDQAPVIAGPTLYRMSGNGPSSITLTLTDPGQYSEISWEVDDAAAAGSGSAFVLDASNPAYNRIGEHFVTVKVIKNEVPYNKTVSFKVEY